MVPQDHSPDVEKPMTLATKLFGIIAVCALCCSLPLTAVLTAGVFELGAVAWGISGGIASIVVAAILAIIVSRKSKSTDPVCQCCPVESNDAPPAIACTLSSGDYQARTKSIRELAANSLLSARRTPLSLHLVYDRNALPAVQELMRDEQRCCAFLDFKISNQADSLHLSITAPVEAAEAADALFTHFAPELAHQKS